MSDNGYNGTLSNEFGQPPTSTGLACCLIIIVLVIFVGGLVVNYVYDNGGNIIDILKMSSFLLVNR